MPALYDADYARKYRTRDEELDGLGTYHDLVRWIGGVCDRFDRPIDVLDLGCGTGRYFWGLRNVNTLTGIDASAPMLEQAAHPTHAAEITARQISLIKGDLNTHAFPERSFDLVYSIGVLAEHVALTRELTTRVASWLRPGGRFAFTTVDPQSPDVPKTMGRRIATALLPLTPGGLGGRLHHRLMVGGMYGDERWVRATLDRVFDIESFDRFRSDVHLHGRCVSRLREDASAAQARVREDAPAGQARVRDDASAGQDRNL
jgi:SAM-dependent methyltransferase